jgi:hypothetical protein
VIFIKLKKNIEVLSDLLKIKIYLNMKVHIQSFM